MGKEVDLNKRKIIIKNIIFVIITLILSFLILEFGNGNSFIESTDDMISVLLVFLGFAIATLAFIHQSVSTNEKSTTKLKELISAISLEILLLFIFLVVMIILNFLQNALSNVILQNICILLINALGVYSFIEIADIILALINIFKQK